MIKMFRAFSASLLGCVTILQFWSLRQETDTCSHLVKTAAEWDDNVAAAILAKADAAARDSVVNATWGFFTTTRNESCFLHVMDLQISFLAAFLACGVVFPRFKTWIRSNTPTPICSPHTTPGSTPPQSPSNSPPRSPQYSPAHSPPRSPQKENIIESHPIRTDSRHLQDRMQTLSCIAMAMKNIHKHRSLTDAV